MEGDVDTEAHYRFLKFLLFKKLDHAQWIGTVAVFLCLVLFQMFLKGSSVLEGIEKDVEQNWGDVKLLKEVPEKLKTLL